MTPWNKGKKGVMPEPWNKGLKGFGAGNKNGMWKGDEVSLSGLHKWVYSRLGQPDTCEHCKKSGLKGHQIHWANKSGKYKRKKNDWVRLCVKCHWEFDEISKKTWEARDKNETRKWS